MTPDTYIAALRESLNATPVAKSLWTQLAVWTNPNWTTAMTIALGATAHKLLPAAYVAGKGIDSSLSYCDPYRRREYLALDLTVYDNGNWSAPLMIVEHENSPSLTKVQYCAWKLLSVHADQRVLIAYFDSSNTYAGFAKTAGEIEDAVCEVLADHQNKPLLLVTGDWSAAWNRIFSGRMLHQSAA